MQQKSKSSIFLPDNRNRGGMEQINSLINNHKKALKKVKPILSSLVPPHLHVDSSKKIMRFLFIIAF